MQKPDTISVPDEDLKVGDLVLVIGTVRQITEIRPYKGPYTKECFAVVNAHPGVGFSLWHGQYTDKVVIERKD